MSEVININSFKTKLFSIVFFISVLTADVLAQGQVVKKVPTPPAPAEESSFMWYLFMGLLVAGLVGMIVWRSKNKDAQEDESKKMSNSVSDKSEKFHEGLPKTSNLLKKKNSGGRSFKKSMAKIKQKQFETLPINNFDDLKEVAPYNLLPLSNDKGLISAVEQAKDEFEEDVDVRELSVKILAKFRNRNSVGALSDIALYDLSAQLRSKAVSILAEFDHESVFETILLACADPTREVRAAAARALFQLTFSRGDAWTRIAICEDDFRMVQAARAAIESDLVRRSIDRLVHDDENHAYEAFALVALLARAGETREIFELIEDHNDKNVKLAIFQALKVLKEEQTLPDLYSFIERNSLPADLSNAANETIRECELVLI